MRWIFPIAFLLFVLAAPSAWAQKRMALVIGNADYLHESKLGNPANDARLISRTLRGLGFTVEEKLNLRQREMTLAIGRFVRESAGADTALLYYAGHGMQPLNGGRNYLLPVDANIDSDDALEADAIPADRIVEQLERQANPARLRLVVLDACRNNRQAGRARSGVRGLARMAPSDDYTLIAFSTNDQDVAQDGNGANSPYAEALSRHISKANELPLRRIFELTATDVREVTRQKQRPRTYGDLDSRVGLNGQVLASLVAEPTLGNDPARASPNTALAPSGTTTIEGQQVHQSAFVEPPVVLIPAGQFLMGNTSDSPIINVAELPQRAISIRSFEMGKREISFAEWDQCVTDGGCHHRPSDDGWGRNKHPVVNVSWRDVIDQYIPWLNRRTGKTYRLPSEAEWEYSARAGCETHFNIESVCTIKVEPEQANYDSKVSFYRSRTSPSREKTTPVGSYKPNAWGLYDMHGNVSEWVQDCSEDNYSKGQPTDGLPHKGNDRSCRYRVTRGGSWFDGPFHLRTAFRFSHPDQGRNFTIGFRIARSISGTQ